MGAERAGPPSVEGAGDTWVAEADLEEERAVGADDEDGMGAWKPGMNAGP